MNERERCNFFLLRYVPDAVKNEFVNIGLVLLPPGGNPELRFTRDLSRVKCLDPQADLELLESLESDLRSKLREVNGDREFILRKIQDSFSNSLQPSAFKACLAESAAEEADTLARLYLEPAQQRQSRETSTRQVIYDRMRREFEIVGVWPLMEHPIHVAEYTGTRDPLKIDCGYGNGAVRMFHAVSLKSEMNSVNAAKVLAFSFPMLAEGIRRRHGKATQLTAIVEDEFDRDQEFTGFAAEILKGQSIQLAPLARMPEIADKAAKEMGIL